MCLGLGFSRKSFAFSIIGVLLLLFSGMALQGEGLDVVSGSTVVINDSATLVTTTTNYTNYNMDNSTWILILSNIAIYGGLVLVAGLMFIAVKRAYKG